MTQDHNGEFDPQSFSLKVHAHACAHKHTRTETGTYAHLPASIYEQAETHYSCLGIVHVRKHEYLHLSSLHFPDHIE